MDFNALMWKLDPANIAQVVDIPVLGARQRLNLPPCVETYKEVEAYAVSSYVRLHNALFNTDVEMPVEMAFSKTLRLLRADNFARFSDQCKRGTNGGLPGLVDLIVKRLIETETENRIQHALHDALPHPYDTPAIEALMTEYLELFGQHLPFASRSITSLCLQYREILSNHAQVINKIRAITGEL